MTTVATRLGKRGPYYQCLSERLMRKHPTRRSRVGYSPINHELRSITPGNHIPLLYRTVKKITEFISYLFPIIMYRVLHDT